jgi:hypothetical protein
MSLLTQMLPAIAALAFTIGASGYGVAKLYGFGALAPESLSVRKSAQSRAGSLTRWLGVGGVGGFGYLALTGTLAEMVPLVGAATLTLGGMTFLAGEVYGRTRETALQPIGRRFGALGLTAGLYLAGVGLAAVAPVAALLGYTAYAAYKSE